MKESAFQSCSYVFYIVLLFVANIGSDRQPSIVEGIWHRYYTLGKHTITTQSVPTTHTTVTPWDPPNFLHKCPSVKELNGNCVCYPALLLLECNFSANPFEFEHKYSIRRININILNQTTMDGQHFARISSESVEVNNCNNINTISNDILKLAHNSLKINAKLPLQQLNLSSVSRSITLIEISNVNQLDISTIPEYNKLKQLSIRKANFDPPLKMQLNTSGLKVIRIQHTDFDGDFQVVYDQTICSKPIIIDLRNNKLKQFDFKDLLLPNPNCQFILDLSYNNKLEKDFLKNQIGILHTHSTQIKSLQLRGIKVNCDCGLVNLFHTRMSHVLHNVLCDNYQKRIESIQLENCQDAFPNKM